jgi:hypothetical protein
MESKSVTTNSPLGDLSATIISKPKDRLSIWFVVRGFLKGFASFFVPFALLKRSVNFWLIRRAVALGIFVGGVRSADRIVKSLFGDELKQEPSWMQFIRKNRISLAAFLAAFGGLAVDGELQNSSIVTLWSLIRAVRTQMPSSMLGPTALMCFSSGIIVPTYLFARDEMNKIYGHFILRQSDKSLQQLNKVASGVTSVCEFIHPGMSCPYHGVWYIWSGFVRSLRIYAPVFGIAFILNPKRNVIHTLMNICRSSMFLSLYVAFAWLSGCVLNSFYQYEYARWPLFFQLSVCGLATLVERPDRQAELASYCFTYALDCLYLGLVKRQYLVHSNRRNALLIALSLGVVFRHVEQQPKPLMDFFFRLNEKTK